jgi:hypothetical protein
MVLANKKYRVYVLVLYTEARFYSLVFCFFAHVSHFAYYSFFFLFQIALLSIHLKYTDEVRVERILENTKIQLCTVIEKLANTTLCFI